MVNDSEVEEVTVAATFPELDTDLEYCISRILEELPARSNNIIPMHLSIIISGVMGH